VQARRYALQNAVRLALAGSLGFALTLGVLDDPHAATYAIFGCFGMLLFADFAGRPAVRLRSYLLLWLTGLPLIVVGTLCSREPWLAVVAMALVGFAILFSGVLGGTLAAGSTATLLAFVLSVAIPAPAAELDERLLGWCIAAALAIPATMLLWPTRPRDRLRTAAADGCRAFAALARAHADGDGELVAARAAAAREAAHAAREIFYATPYRPAGASGSAAALAALVDDLDWLGQFAVRTAPHRDDEPFPAASDELHAAVAELLDGAAARLDGRPAAPDFARLTRARETFGAALLTSLETCAPGEEERIERELEHAFALRMQSYAAWHLAADALRARGETVPEIDADDALHPHSVMHAAGEQLGSLRRRGTRNAKHAAAYATTRSVWFRNSVRGALGLALAIGIGQAADLQHVFWIVLGTVSVLRSRALSTGASAVQAIAGTLAGIVAGGLIVLLVGDHHALLWALLPAALLLAGYAPRAISFVAGQAAFSLAVLVIFNLIEPVGWSVGLIRIEDIAIGCAISLAVGLLLWPRGATSVLRDSLAAAYASSAAVLAATVSDRLGRDAGEDGELRRAIDGSIADARRLDDAFRQFLAEPAGQHGPFADLARLVAGGGRVRRAAHSLRTGSVLLPLDGAAAASGERAGGAAHALARRRDQLERETAELREWLTALGAAIAAHDAPPAVSPVDDYAAGGVRLLRGAAGSEGDAAPLRQTATIAWSRQHLVALRQLEPRLAEAAQALAR
jgi:uncharacterized membrane protein YccC